MVGPTLYDVQEHSRTLVHPSVRVIEVAGWKVSPCASTRSMARSSRPLDELALLLNGILIDARLVPEHWRSLEGYYKGWWNTLNDALGGWFNEQGSDEESWPRGKPDSFRSLT